MIRVIHLLAGDADFQTRRCVEYIVRGLGGGFAVEARTLGAGGLYRDMIAAVRALRREDRSTIVHAWGTAALKAAAAAARGAVFYSPLSAGPDERRLLRAVMAHREIRVVCDTATKMRQLAEGGTDPGSCALARPGVDFSRVRPVRDQSLREALGFADEHIVGLALGQSCCERAMWTGGILHELDGRFRMLIWAEGRALDGAAAAVRRLGTGAFVRIVNGADGRDFESMLAAADYALLAAAEDVAPLPVCMCMAGGLPLAAPAAPAVCELLEDRHTALLAGGNTPADLAGRVLAAMEDKELRRRIAQCARSEAYAHFRLTAYLDTMRSLYGGSGPRGQMAFSG